MLAGDGALYSFRKVLQLPDDGGLVYGGAVSGGGSGYRAYGMGMAAEALDIPETADGFQEEVSGGEN